MPRHAFKFPSEVVAAIKQHVKNAIDAVDPKRNKQEPPYTAALVNRLEGTVYEGEHGSVTFTSTVIDDRGRNSAEHQYGADFAITATISDGDTTINKVILVQAKLGHVSDLDANDRKFLKEQIGKMKKL